MFCPIKSERIGDTALGERELPCSVANGTIAAIDGVNSLLDLAL
jgi:hypothetical protein